MDIIKQYFYMVKAAWRFSYEQRWQMTLFYSLSIISNIIYMMQPYIVGQFINALQAGGDDLLDNVMYYLGLYALIYIAFWIFHGPSRVIENCLAFNIQKNFKMFYYNMLGSLPLSWHYEHHSGNTINRINNSSLALHDFSCQQFKYINIIIRFVTAFIMLGIIDLYVMSAALALVTVIIFYMVYLDKKIVRQVFLANEKTHVFSAQFFDYISNMLNVIGFNLQKPTTSALTKRMDNIYPHMLKKYLINEWKWCTKMVLISIGIFVILYSYIAYHENNHIPFMIGTVIMIFQYLERIESILSQIAEMFYKLASQYTDYMSVKPIRASHGIYQDNADTVTKKLTATKGKISFKNVDFCYNEDIAIFKGLDLEIAPNEKVGLVGVSGAGKTTIINLLLRSYKIDGGSICIDDQDIYKCTSQSVIENIALIPQDISLFEENILENIRYGRIDASDEEVISAAKKAHAHNFIDTLPDKYDTLVGERGIRLSGGQRQRVTIARAILKNTPILILDEATSALDSESEVAIQKSLDTVMKGKTVIAIAHRLSTLANMDRIIVMDKGRIVESDSHKNLIKKDGVYAKLWLKQSDGFLTDN